MNDVVAVTALERHYHRAGEYMRICDGSFAHAPRQLRNQAHRSLEPGVKPPANPFTYGSWRSNVAEVLCRPAGLSWLDGRADVCEDKRRVNPGLDDVWDDPEGHHA